MSRMRHVAVILITSLFALCGCAITRPARETPAGTAGGSTQFIIGACTHFSQGKGTLGRNIESIRQAGQGSYVTPWGQRDWAARRTERVPNRLSVVAGHRPVLIGNDLASVSVVEVIPRLREVSQMR